MANKPDLGAMFGAGDAKTFLGLPECNDISELTADIAILGVPSATPYASVGPYCAAAPAAIRKAFSVFNANLQHYDFDMGGALMPEGSSAVDCGDLPYTDDAAHDRGVIKQAVEDILQAGAFPILMGGDDSIPIPMLQAFAATGKKYTILQIDAHIDWRDDVDGEDMGLSSTMRRASEMPHIEHIIQVGQRGIGSARVTDVQDALDWGVKFISGLEVQLCGVEQVLDAIPTNNEVIICFDCDAMDPAIIPGVIGRAAGGVSYAQLMQIIQGVAQKTRIAAFDLVEYMPERDVDDIGALTAGRIVASVMGIAARQKNK